MPAYPPPSSGVLSLSKLESCSLSQPIILCLIFSISVLSSFSHYPTWSLILSLIYLIHSLSHRSFSVSLSHSLSHSLMLYLISLSHSLAHSLVFCFALSFSRLCLILISVSFFYFKSHSLFQFKFPKLHTQTLSNFFASIRKHVSQNKLRIDRRI